MVNFGATETYVSDKRPFFTENQGIFDFGLLNDNSQLVYTRRVGGPSDDGSGAAGINAAVKLNGSVVAPATAYWPPTKRGRRAGFSVLRGSPTISATRAWA